MKILFLTPGCFDKGGISRYSRYQVRALRELVGPNNVFVFSLLGPSDEDFEDPFDVTYYPGSSNSLRQRISYVSSVYAAALRIRPDLILSAHLNLSGIAKVLSKLVGARSVLNIYGAEAWSKMRRDAAWGLSNTDHVISDCHFTARYLEDNRWRPENSVSVVWDCVDLDRFSPASPALNTLKKYGIPDPDEGVNILTLGRMGRDTAYKGYQRLLEAFSLIAAQLPNTRLIYAGRGEMVERLRGQAEKMGLGPRVYFTGMVHEDDLADIYRSAHIFSLVTDRGEGTGEGIPLTPLEASACAVPLIVGNHDGSQEAVVEGSTGYVVEPFDLQKQSEILVTLATNPELRRRMGRAARKRAEDEFAFPKFLKKHEELLELWFSGKSKTLMLKADAQRAT